VVVGSSALGLADRVATPLSSSIGGVTVHVAALSAILDAADGRSPAPAPAWVMPAWLVASVLLLWLTVAAGRRLRPVLLLLCLTLGTWVVLAAWVTASSAPQTVSGPLWGYGVILLLHLPIEWSWAQARVRTRTRLLARYVAKPVLDELLATGGEDPLAPRHAEITVLIADMENYTRVTSRSSLRDAAELTRGFLEQLTGPVLAHRGTLDRYTGDGLVSFWGAPIAMPDHADRAVDAAIDIQRKVERFNEDRRMRGLDPVTARIGIASGSALVGDLGTPFRIAYTAVGDCINLASRLQQMTRELDVGIAVSSSAVEQCRRWSFERLGTYPVRGLPDQAVFTPSQSGPPPDPPPGVRAPAACG
jgi:adenylate cyclase